MTDHRRCTRSGAPPSPIPCAGDVDIVTFGCSGDQDVFWFESDGAPNPSFTKHTTYLTTTARDCKLVDIDGDGRLDILFATFGGASIFIQEGAQPPSFFEVPLASVSGFAHRVLAGRLEGSGTSR